MSTAVLIAAARSIVRNKTPWTWPLIQKCILVEDPTIETACITKACVLRINPTWVETLDVKCIAGLLFHEVMHLVLKHTSRVGLLNPQLYNVAGDIVINAMLGECGYSLPLGGMLGSTFGIDPKGKTTEEVYVLLQKLFPPSGAGAPDPKCGSGAGNPQPGDGESDVEDGRASSEVEAATKATVSEAQVAAGKRAGNVPAELRREFDALLSPPKVSWRKVLGVAVRRAIQWRAGATHQRYDAPSCRQGGLGYGPGVPILPRLRQAIPRVTVAWDTSGSMGTHEMQSISAELNGILQACGASVDVVACDARVHGEATVTRVREAVNVVKRGGGGGTDFRPVFEARAKRKISCDLLVFATDGYGHAPVKAPPYPVVWLLVGGSTAPCSWGQAIKVED